jgi:hypothetical protein
MQDLRIDRPVLVAAREQRIPPAWLAITHKY